MISMALKMTPLSELHLYCKVAHTKSRLFHKKYSIRIALQPASSGIHYFIMPRQNTLITMALTNDNFQMKKGYYSDIFSKQIVNTI